MYTGNAKKLAKLIKKNGFNYAMFVTEYQGAFYHSLHHKKGKEDENAERVLAKVTDDDAVLIKDQELINTILAHAEEPALDNGFNPSKVMAVMINPNPDEIDSVLNADCKLFINVFELHHYDAHCISAEDDIAEEILGDLGINHKASKRAFPGWKTLDIGNGAFVLARENVADSLLGELSDETLKKRMGKHEKKILKAMKKLALEKAWKDMSCNENAEKRAVPDSDEVIGILVGGMFKRPCGMVLEVMTKKDGFHEVFEIEGDTPCFDYLEKLGIDLENDDFFADWNYLGIDEEDFALFNKNIKLTKEEAVVFADKIKDALTAEELISWCEEEGIQITEERLMENIAEFLLSHVNGN